MKRSKNEPAKNADVEPSRKPARNPNDRGLRLKTGVKAGVNIVKTINDLLNAMTSDRRLKRKIRPL